MKTCWQQPEKTLRELCQFIEVEFLEDMLEPQKGKHEHQPSSLTGNSRKHLTRRRPFAGSA